MIMVILAMMTYMMMHFLKPARYYDSNGRQSLKLLKKVMRELNPFFKKNSSHANYLKVKGRSRPSKFQT